MAAHSAIGMIETKGVVPLIEASDAMLKAADVAMIGWEKLIKAGSSQSLGLTCWAVNVKAVCCTVKLILACGIR